MSKDGSDIAYSTLDLLMSKLRVSVVVRIDKYNASEGTADITPVVIEERILDDEREPIPAISMKGCPVIWPMGGGRRLEWGLSKGDLCLGLYRHRSHDEIDGGSAGIVQPVSDRRVNIADLVVLPGFFAPSSGAPAGSYKNNGQPVLSMNGGEAVSVGQSGANFYLVREDTLAQYINSLVSWIAGHTHDGGILGGGLTGPPKAIPPVPVPVPPDFKSTRIKVDA